MKRKPAIPAFRKIERNCREWLQYKSYAYERGRRPVQTAIVFRRSKKVVDHISRGINPHINTEEYIRPIFNYYNRFSSTKYVNGNTSKDVLSHTKKPCKFCGDGQRLGRHRCQNTGRNTGSDIVR